MSTCETINLIIFQSVAALKIDMSKAYDWINWKFIQAILEL